MKRITAFVKKLSGGDFLFGIFILLMIIPQTGQPIQVGINRLKMMVWSPSIEDDETQPTITAFDYSLRNLDNENVIQPIGEGRITFLSLWATWCAPCVAELPSIEALYQDYRDRIDFVLVTHENPELVRGFLQKKDLNLPVYFPASTLPEGLQSKSLPTNYLIDGEGNILVKETGAANWNSKKVRGLLDKLLVE
ncbi:MAG: TlpA disulfide reductase family protein [Bacteroidota bacterium]